VVKDSKGGWVSQYVNADTRLFAYGEVAAYAANFAAT